MPVNDTPTAYNKYQNSLADARSGNPIPNVEVYVFDGDSAPVALQSPADTYVEATNGTLATLYTSETDNTPVSQPLTTGANGQFTFYVPYGRYDLVFVLRGIVRAVWRKVYVTGINNVAGASAIALSPAVGGHANVQAYIASLADPANSNSLYGGNIVHRVEKLSDLMGTSGTAGFMAVELLSFYLPLYALVDPFGGGGGLLVWNATADKNTHNGGTVIDPTHSVTPGDAGWWTPENAGAGVWVRRFEDLWAEDFGVNINAAAANNTTGLQVACDYASSSDIRVLNIGPAPITTPIKIDGGIEGDGVKMLGRGGHTSETVLQDESTSGDTIWLKSRSSGIEGIRLHSSAARRSGGALTDAALLLSGGDVASPNSMSRCIVRDVSVTNGPGIGVNWLGGTEYGTFDTITAQGFKGSPFVIDDGSTKGYSNLVYRSFATTFVRLRAFECGGNVLIGHPSQAQIPRLLTFEHLEALDCAYDSGVRIREEQVLNYGYGTIFNQLDFENQRYANSSDQLGNTKPSLAVPVKGLFVSGHGCTLNHPYFSSLTQSVEVAAAMRGFEFYWPQIIGGTYGTPQTYGFVVPSSVEGLRYAYHTSDCSGATQVLKNQSRGAVGYKDGRRQMGINYSPFDWDVDERPVEVQISSGVLTVTGRHVNVRGALDDTDFLGIIRLQAGDNGREGCDVWLHNRGTRDTGTITAITKANPAVSTSAGHGRSTGDKVFLSVSGMTEVDGAIYTITVIDPDSFSLDGVDSTGYGTFTSGSWTHAYDLTAQGTGNIVSKDGSPVVIPFGGSLHVNFNPDTDRYYEV